MFRRSTGEPGIWVADADGTGARRVFDWTGYDLQTIEWSADGKTDRGDRRRSRSWRR